MGLVVTAGLPAIHGTRIRQNRGSVEYRISSKEKNSDAWKPMKQACQDKDGSTHFELPVTPSKGTWYIQFRVRSGGTTLELTDWNVSVPATAQGRAWKHPSHCWEAGARPLRTVIGPSRRAGVAGHTGPALGIFAADAPVSTRRSLAVGHDFCLAVAAIVEHPARHVISPNIHAIIVHFPLGIFVFGLFLEVFGFLWRRSTVRIAAHWMVLFGGLLALPAAMTGIDAYWDVMNHSRGEITDVQRALLYKHLLITGIGAGIAALTVTAALGLVDIWRRSLWLYFPLLLVLVVAASMLTFGSHFGGEGIYLQGVAVQLKGQPSVGFEYWAPAQSTHILLAGLGAALALGALGMSIRVVHRARLVEDEAVTDRELEALHARTAPAAAVADDAGTIPVAPPAATVVPAGANDLLVARTLNADATLPAPRVPSGRFWLLTSVLFLITLGFGVWLLISVEDSSWLDNNKPTVANVWQKVYETAKATTPLSQNRQGFHIVIGAALAVFPLILAMAVRLMPRQRVLIGVLSLIVLLLLVAEIWIGVLLLNDKASGPLFRFAPDTDRSTTIVVPQRS